MKVTKSWIDYQITSTDKPVYIPAGVPVLPATNLPQGGYWVQTWAGLAYNEKAESWHRNYGFHVTEEQVADSPFYVGQRVRIKPCEADPKIKSNKGYRYGIVQGATQHPGMHLHNENGRISDKGEWAFTVASYHSPRAGALWYSTKGLEPMKKEMKKS